MRVVRESVESSAGYSLKAAVREAVPYEQARSRGGNRVSDDYDAPHPILDAIVQAKQEGRDHITREEFEDAFGDDPETRDYVVDRLNEESKTDSSEEPKSVLQRIKDWFSKSS